MKTRTGEEIEGLSGEQKESCRAITRADILSTMSTNDYSLRSIALAIEHGNISIDDVPLRIQMELIALHFKQVALQSHNDFVTIGEKQYETIIINTGKKLIGQMPDFGLYIIVVMKLVDEKNRIHPQLTERKRAFEEEHHLRQL